MATLLVIYSRFQGLLVSMDGRVRVCAMDEVKRRGCEDVMRESKLSSKR